MYMDRSRWYESITRQGSSTVRRTASRHSSTSRSGCTLEPPGCPHASTALSAGSTQLTAHDRWSDSTRSPIQQIPWACRWATNFLRCLRWQLIFVRRWPRTLPPMCVWVFCPPVTHQRCRGWVFFPRLRRLVCWLSGRRHQRRRQRGLRCFRGWASWK